MGARLYIDLPVLARPAEGAASLGATPPPAALTFMRLLHGTGLEIVVLAPGLDPYMVWDWLDAHRFGDWVAEVRLSRHVGDPSPGITAQDLAEAGATPYGVLAARFRADTEGHHHDDHHAGSPRAAAGIGGL